MNNAHVYIIITHYHRAVVIMESAENGTRNLESNSTDGHVVPNVRSRYEGNVDQPLDPPGNVDMPLSPRQAQDASVVYNPSAVHKPPPATRFSRYSHEPSDSVELRYIRSRTTSEVRSDVRDSYYHENASAFAAGSPTQPSNNSSELQPIMSTSTRI